jgi:uncharacterized membrane protein (DUF106 family)
MKKEDIEFLNELLVNLEKFGSELEEAYKSNDIEKFNQIKKMIIESEKKMARVIK